MPPRSHSLRLGVSVLALAFALALQLVAPPACEDAPASGDNSDDARSDTAGDAPGLGRDLVASDADDAEDLGAGDVASGDAVDEELTEDATGDTGSGGDGADDVATTDGPDDEASSDLRDGGGGTDVDPGQVTDLELVIESEGGFTGWGDRDYAYLDGTLSVHYPYSDPADCSGELTEGQVAELYAAVGAVDWASIEPDYWPPSNLDCCCDQFYYALSVHVTYVNANPVEAETEWCTQSLGEELLPAGFAELLGLLHGYGTAILEACAAI